MPEQQLPDEDSPHHNAQTVSIWLNTSDDGQTITFQVLVDDDLAEEKCVHDDFIVTIEPWRVTVTGQHVNGGDIYWSVDIDADAYEAMSKDPGSVVEEILMEGGDMIDFVYDI